MALSWCVRTLLVQKRLIDCRGAVHGEADGLAGFHLNTVFIDDVNGRAVGAPINVWHGHWARCTLADGLAIQGDFVLVATLKTWSAANLKGDIATTAVECLFILWVSERD